MAAAKAETKAAPTFDRTKDHGTVWGEHGARFEQGGNYFDAEGTLVGADTAVVNQGVAVDATTVKPAAKDDDQVAKQVA